MGGYTQIDGEKYETELLKIAEEHVEKDGKINIADAKALWESACDGPGATAIERATLAYIASKHKCTPVAAKFLKDKTSVAPSGKSYYKQIDGKKYVRALLDEAELLTKDKVLDKADAEALWKHALNGGVVTATEKATMRYIADQDGFKLTKGAKTFFSEQLDAAPKAGEGDKEDGGDDDDEGDEGDESDGPTLADLLGADIEDEGSDVDGDFEPGEEPEDVDIESDEEDDPHAGLVFGGIPNKRKAEGEASSSSKKRK